MTRRTNTTRRERGQSMVETVVVLWVVLLLFLGLWYMKALADTRMRAVEAARYLTWESVWNARPDPAKPSLKSNGALTQELKNMGLGSGLVESSVDGGKARRSLKAYSDSIQGGQQGFSDVPQFIVGFFQNPDKASTSSSNAPGTNQVPSFDSVSGVIQTFLDVGGDLTFGLSDLVAKMTLFEEEADKSVVTTFVTYRVRGTSVFQFLGDTDISQTASILAHPYNVVRSNDQTEYDRVFGTGGLGDCFTGSGRGHIFDLWFLPTVPIPGVSAVANVGKCFLTELGSFAGITDNVPVIGGDLGFKIPDGTLKEYPEKNL